MTANKGDSNGQTQAQPVRGVVRESDRGVVQPSAQPLVPVVKLADAGQAISNVFMGWLIHTQFTGQWLDYPRCISCGADAHTDQMVIDVYDDYLGGRIVATARLCISCWNLHQNILKHCITMHTEK